MGSIFSSLIKMLGDTFPKYAEVILGIVVGMFLSTIYDKFVGYKKLTDSYNQIIESKQEHIESLKIVIGSELKKIEVEKKDKQFFDKLKKYFSNKK
jgi:uncharacterized membrane protein (DUF106 family)